MQGVSINIFIKTNEKKKGKLAVVNHFEMFGKREEKYSTLIENSINSIEWNKLDFKEPYYFFVPKNFAESNDYLKGFKLDKLFCVYSTGAESQKDEVTIHYTKNELDSVITDFKNLNENEIARKYSISDGRDWKIHQKQM